MATVVVLKEGKVKGIVGVAPEGCAFGMDAAGRPASLGLGQPGGLLQMTPRGEGVKVSRLPGAPPLQVGEKELDSATLLEDDQLRLGSWTLQVIPGVDSKRSADAGVPARLFEIVAEAARARDPGDLLQALLDEALRRFDAERGFVLYRRRAADPLEPVASHAIDAAEARSSRVSKTVVEKALSGDQPILVGDAAEEFAQAESVQLEGIRSILCAPLGKHGAFYLDSRTGNRSYDSSDLELFTTFAGYARLALELFLESDALRRRAARGEAGAEPADVVRLVVGESPRMQALVQELDQVAREDVTVLVMGETGTGKEVLAREVHLRSPRAAGPFVAVNCMAFAREVLESELFGHEKGAFTGAEEQRLGRFELADGGTLFLDEVGELSHEVQVKLLRVLQERVIERVGGRRPVPVDIRVVAATNRDLSAAVKEGSFREDLYYRINVFTLSPPPLRERKEDIPALAASMVERLNRRMGKSIEGLDDAALAALKAHDWPGNVRELGNVMERALVLSRTPTIGPGAFPFGGLAGAAAASGDGGGDFLAGLPDSLPEARDHFERVFMLRALKSEKGNVAAAARRLDVPRSTIYRKCEQFGIDLKSITR